MGLSQAQMDDFDKGAEELKAMPDQPEKQSKSRVDYEAEWTSDGLAEKMAERYGENLLFSKSLDWIVYMDGYWDTDSDPVTWAIRAMMKQEMNRVIHELKVATEAEKSQTTDADRDAQKAIKKKKQGILNWLKSQRTSGGYKGIKDLASSYKQFKTHKKQFDQHPFFLNCLNGTLNLNTGILHEHRREDYLTKRLDVAYQPDAKCPQWEKFIDDIMLGDPELKRYLQQIVGLCLSGDTVNHCFYILWGSGRNGKSTFIVVLQKLLGSYAIEVPSSLLMSHKTSPHGHTEGLARLAGVRLATANESDEDKRLAEAQVKQMVGGDNITARKPYAKDSFDFTPEYKLFLRTNHRPRIHGTETGIWSRIKLIPFNAYFPDGHSDKSLPDKLTGELEGILAWAVRGYHDYLAHGLIEPERVKMEVRQYREQEDSFRLFLQTEIIPHINAGEGIQASQLHQQYEAWAAENDGQTISMKRMSARLENMGWTTEKTVRGMMKYPPAQSFRDS